jgi:hypothetical protein
MQITINEVEYPLQWGMGALEIYCDLMECDLDGLGMVEDRTKPLQMQKAISTLVYAGIKNGCEVNDIDCQLTMAKLRVYLDDAPQEQFEAIMKDFADSKYLGKTIRQHLYGDLVVEETDKKKAKPAKRTPSAKS